MPCNAPPYLSLVTYLFGALTTLAGVLITNIFANRRDRQNREHAAEIAKENRKQDFIGLMNGIRSQAERFAGEHFAGNIFPNSVYDISRESPKIMRDLAAGKKVEFDNAITALCRLTGSQITEGQSSSDFKGRATVTAAIDRVIAALS